jgi:peptidoglycan/LPS O-acetylase OafA/YrhL
MAKNLGASVDDARTGEVAPDKLVCFDAIRGVAAMMVVVAHIAVMFYPGIYWREGPQWDAAPVWWQYLVKFFISRLWSGYRAVVIFFVLSGFVLSLSFFQKGSVRSVGLAALRRYPRLMFPAAASVFISLALMKVGAIDNRAAANIMYPEEGYAKSESYQPPDSHIKLMTMYQFSPTFSDALHQTTWVAFTTGYVEYNVVLWTMPIELLGSFLVFGSLALFGTLRNRWLIYVLCTGVIAIRFSSFRDLERSLDLFYLCFIAGMALCDLSVYNWKYWHRSLPLRYSVPIAVIGFVAIKFEPLAALIVIAAVAFSPRFQELLATRSLAFLGRISFGVYLVHMAILCSFGCATYIFLRSDRGLSHLSGTLAAGAVTIVATLLGGWLMYRLVDRPTVAFTHWFTARLFKPKPEPTKPACEAGHELKKAA